MAKQKKFGTPQDPNAWMVTFSDLMTLLLTFFVLLLTMKSMGTKSLESMFGVFSGAVGMFGFGEKSVMVSESIMPARLTQMDAETLRKLMNAEITDSEGSQGALELKGAGGKEKEGIKGRLGGGEGIGAGNTKGQLKRKTMNLKGGAYAPLEKEVADIVDFAVGKTAAGQAGKERPRSYAKGIVVIHTTRGIVIRVPSEVMFDSGSAKIVPGAIPLLNRVGKFMIKKKYKAEIEGHTDDIPIHSKKFPSNWELSTARAVNVLRYLTARFKIPPENISAYGFGEKNTLVPNASDLYRAKNRRVVIVLYRDRGI